MYYPDKEIPVMVPEELMIFNMKYKGVRDVIWPPRTELFPSANNASREFSLRTIKYAFQNSDWLEAGARSGTAFKDLLGMKYAVPKGMSNIEYLTDMPIFLGSPHRKYLKTNLKVNLGGGYFVIVEQNMKPGCSIIKLLRSRSRIGLAAP